MTNSGQLTQACRYCGGGKRTGLPGNSCENCMNTGLANPSAADIEPRGKSDEGHYLSAIRQRLERLYDVSADDARLREQLSDEVDWVDEQLALEMADLRETRKATKMAILQALLREARQYVSDAGNDEDYETQQHSTLLLTAIDEALRG